MIPYFNVGFEVNGSNSGQEKVLFDLGLEYDIFAGGRRLSTYIDVIGSNTVTNQMGSGDDRYDLGLGIKYAATDRGVFFANEILPINDSGLRPNATYLMGFTWFK